MKKIPLLVAALVFISLTSCKKTLNAIFPGVTYTLPTLTINVPPIPFADSTQEIDAGSFTVNFNTDSAVRANTGGVFGLSSVNSIVVKQVTLSVTNADALNNLSALKSFRISLTSGSNSTPVNLINVNVPDTATTSYTATPNAPNLVGYLSSNTLNNTIYGRIRKATTETLDLNVQVTLYAK